MVDVLRRGRAPRDIQAQRKSHLPVKEGRLQEEPNLLTL